MLMASCMVAWAEGVMRKAGRLYRRVFLMLLRHREVRKGGLRAEMRCAVVMRAAG